MNVAKRKRLQKRLDWWTNHLERLMEAHIALVEGGVRSFKIENRELTKFDISKLLEDILAAEQKVEELEAILAGFGSRKIAGVIPRDW